MKNNGFPIRKIVILSLFSLIVVIIGLTINKTKNLDNPSVLGESAEPTPTKAPKVAEIIGVINKQWFLIADNLAPADQVLEFKIVVNGEDKSFTETKYLIPEIDMVGLVTQTGDNSYQARVKTDGFKPGEYSIVARFTDSDGLIIESTPNQFFVSYPVYVAWTFDWEGYDVADKHLTNITDISQKYNVPITHFYNPAIMVSSKISSSRKAYLTDWVIDRYENSNDAIALHLHMFPEMVAAAGVTPIADPIRWGDARNDGYDVITGQYSVGDMVKMLTWSRDQFAANGLPTPTIFRAGGWYASMNTLQALELSGFTADSSGRTPYSFGTNKLEGFWQLSATTQPYQPNRNDQNSSAAPNLKIMEFPNNGGDSWSYSAAEMISRFDENYAGGVATDPRLVTYVSHPEWFDRDDPKMRAVFDYLADKTYVSGSGPVVYITLADAQNVWQNVVEE